MNIKLHPKAEKDLEEALKHYLAIDKALKKKFIHHNVLEVT